MRTWPLLVTLASFWPRLVSAAEPDYRAPPPQPDIPEDVDLEPEPAPSRGFELDPPSKFGVGLEGYAGIGTEFTSGDEQAHGLVGGLLRGRFHYVQIGATYEITDAVGHWRAIGGYAGAFLPFYRWIDVDASVGVSARTYVDPNSMYGEGGLKETVPSLTFRFGVSDRLTNRLVSPRVGAVLALAFDLARRDVAWRHEYALENGGTSVTTGTTAIGGISIGLLVNLGFEVGARSP
jgi:hypothetical protein